MMTKNSCNYYKLITQKPFCCVPVSIKMVLVRRKLRKMSQDEIAWELGLNVPFGYEKYFTKVRATEKPVSFGWGTDISKRRFSLNKFFRKYKYPIRMVYHRPQNIKDPKTFIEKNIENGNDVIVCFRNDVPFGKEKYGHVCPIIGIENDYVILADPNRPKAALKRVKLSKLIKAMLVHLRTKNSMAGFWVIKAT